MRFIKEKQNGLPIYDANNKLVKVWKFEGLSEKEVYEILDKYDISYDKKETRYRLSLHKRGTVYKLDTKHKSYVKYGEKVRVSVSAFDMLPLFILLFILAILFGLFRFMVQIPKIERKYKGYTKEDIVRLTRVAKIPFTKVLYYEYCIKEKDSNKPCNWKRTDTKNVLMSENGEWEVRFRGAGVDNQKSLKSNKVFVQIDNIPPVLDYYENYVSKKSIRVKIKAHDNVTKKDKIKYFYSIDDKEYYASNTKYIFTGLDMNSKHKISIKLIDELGNTSIYNYDVKTNNKTQEEFVDIINDDIIVKSEDTKNKSTQDKSSSEDIDRTPPEIDLDKLPSRIYYGEDYSFPSFAKFGKKGGRFVCTLEDNNEYLNSKTVKLGKHTVTCIAYANNGMSKIVSKDFEVIPREARENLVGWIEMALNYPADAVELEWMTSDPANCLSGNGTTDWQDYTGPILVRADKTNTIYMKYKLDNHIYVIPPKNKAVYVVIIPEKSSVLPDESTMVSLDYTKNAKYIRYRINEGKWEDYDGPFVAYPYDEIEAEVIKEEAQYDSNGDFDQMIEYKDSDMKMIGLRTPIDAYSSLNHIKSSFKLGTSRYLKSLSGYGTHTPGSIECYDEKGNNINNTNELSSGEHDITCEVKAKDYPAKGSYAKSSKHVKVQRYVEIDWNWEVWRYYSFYEGTENNILDWVETASDVNTTLDTKCFLNDDENNIITNTKDLKKGRYSVRCKATSNEDLGSFDYTTRWNFEVRTGTDPFINVISGTIYTNQIDRPIYNYDYGVEYENIIDRDHYCILKSNGTKINDDNNTTAILPYGENVINCYIRNTCNYQRTSSGKIKKYDYPYKDIYLSFENLPYTIYYQTTDNYINPYEHLIVKWYNNPIGTTTCSLDNNPIEGFDTRDLSLGNHLLSCTATSPSGRSKTANWNFNVTDRTNPFINAYELDINNYSSPRSIYYANFGWVHSSLVKEGLDRTIECTDQYGKRVYDTNDFSLGKTNFTCTIKNEGGFTYSDTGYVNKYLYRPKASDAPTITRDPESAITDKVKITITPKTSARKIEYKLCSNCAVQTYNGPFYVTNNAAIYAWYYDSTYGVKSYNAYKYIYLSSGPILTLDYSPDWRDEEVRKYPLYETNAIIRTQNVDGPIYYSFDDIKYFEYTGPIHLTESTNIYAKTTDSLGRDTKIGPELVELDTKPSDPPVDEPDDPPVDAPVPVDDPIQVNIIANPERPIDGTIMAYTDIEIKADERADKLEYKLNGNLYTVEDNETKFRLTSNTTIEVIAKGSGYKDGSAKKIVDWLSSGVAQPMCTISPNTKSNNISIDFQYHYEATKKEYSLDGGKTFIEDKGELFHPNKNMVILLREEVDDEFIHNECIVDNYDDPTTIVTLEEDMYYLLEFNYPIFAVSGSEEYQWKQEGFKKYNKNGVLLIKKMYEKEFEDHLNGNYYRVKNSQGNYVNISKDHTYILDISSDKISENMELRWDTITPNAPVINVSPNKYSKKVNFTIDYDKTSVLNEYRILDSTGKLSNWALYNDKDGFTTNENNITIYARSKNIYGVYSDISKAFITNVDNEKPTITAEGDLDSPRRVVNLKLIGIDNSGKINRVSYKKGKHKLLEFNSYDAYYQNNSYVSISENGIYTLYVEDEAGNKNISYIEVNNIDRELPSIFVTFSNTIPYSSSLHSSVDVTIDYGDSIIKEYSFDGINYNSYNGTFTIKADDVRKYLNNNNEVILYSKGIDDIGNENIVMDKLSMLDFNYPSDPVITYGGGYPTLTEYGVKINYEVSINYDTNRNDLDNYYCLKNCANDDNWIKYTGKFDIDESVNEVKAKSIVKTSKIETTVSKGVVNPSDLVPPSFYDGNNSTGFQANTSGNIMYVSKKLYNKNIYITASGSGVNSYNHRESYASFYDKNNNLLNNIQISGNGVQTKEITIPDGTHHIAFYATYNHYAEAAYFYEIRIKNEPVINREIIYPRITEYGINPPFSNVTLTSFFTAKQTLYRINDGDWTLYNDETIRLDVNDTIYAKQIDEKDVESPVSSYTFVTPSDAVGVEAYDGNIDTAVKSIPEKILYVDSSMYNKKLEIISSGVGTNDSDYNYSTRIKMFNANNEILLDQTLSYSPKATHIVTIPQNTSYAVLSYNFGWGANPLFNEIRIVNEPEILNEKIYPIITQYGIEQGYNNITISPFKTAVKTLYKINSGDWIEYNSQDIIRLELNETIYAKQIDKYGVESPISSYTSILPGDAVGVEAYDGNIDTAMSGSSEKKIYVDSSIYNKKVKFVSTGKSNVDKDYRFNTKIKIYNLNNELISEQNLAYTSQAVNIVTIPNNTLYIVTTCNWGYYANPLFHEISVYDVLDITESNINPSLSMTNYSSGSKIIHFEGYNTNNTVEYSIDKTNWNNTNLEDITASYNNTYYIRELDENGVTLRAGTYKLEYHDVFGNEIFDNDNETYNDSSTWGGRVHRIDLNEDTIGNKLLFNITNSSSSPGYIKFYDNSDNELISYTITASGGHSIYIPSNSAYVTFDSSTIKYNEISVGKLDNFVAYPSINVSNNGKWDYQKTITIDYPDGYTNEYSLDNGTTWNEYTEPFIIDKETTILARVRLDNQIISTSSSQVTYIDGTPPSISFEDKYVSYNGKFVPYVKYNKSGGTYTCIIDGVETNDVSSFARNSVHNISCTVTAGDGRTDTMTKDVTITFPYIM